MFVLQMIDDDKRSLYSFVLRRNVEHEKCEQEKCGQGKVGQGKCGHEMLGLVFCGLLKSCLIIRYKLLVDIIYSF